LGGHRPKSAPARVTRHRWISAIVSVGMEIAGFQR
jgi:hypothetical protein